MGKYPVTNAEFGEFIAARGYATEAYWTAMGWKWQRGRLGQAPEPGFWGGERLNQARYPVVGVSWYEAVGVLQLAGARDGARYRLPTEPEWEYAARVP